MWCTIKNRSTSCLCLLSWPFFMCTTMFHLFTKCGFLLFIGSSVFILGLFPVPLVFPICSPSLYDFLYVTSFFCCLYFVFCYLTYILKFNNVGQPACLWVLFESFFWWSVTASENVKVVSFPKYIYFLVCLSNSTPSEQTLSACWAEVDGKVSRPTLSIAVYPKCTDSHSHDYLFNHKYVSLHSALIHSVNGEWYIPSSSSIVLQIIRFKLKSLLTTDHD